MNTSDLFVVASRLKLRFPTTKGGMTVEDLWDLPLESKTGKVNLNELAINTYNAIEQKPTISFVTPVTKKDDINETRLEILKYVISRKQEENAVRMAANAKAEEKRKLLAVLGRKEDAELEQMSKEEVMKRIQDL